MSHDGYPCLVVHPTFPSTVGGGPCRNAASYFAVDNRAKLGHVCRMCWRELPPDERDLYVPQGIARL